MKKFLLKYWRWGVLSAALAFITLCRYVPACGEWYARYVYPSVSAALSATVSCIPFSLEEILVVSVALGLLVYPFYAWKRNVGWRVILKRELGVVACTYCWFYLGWGMNYYRHDFFTRSGLEALPYDSIRFTRFVTDYTEKLNASYTADVRFDTEGLEREIRHLYRQVPERFGLSTPEPWQHPKKVLFNSLYSSVGVLGYMGPFFAESQLNAELPPLQYPFTYVHEYAHLLGVSSEAEANFWAYQLCTRSSSQAVRYSGYSGLLPYVLVNAQSVLDEQAYRGYLKTIRPEVMADLIRKQEYWQDRYSPLVGKMQDAIYSWYLKGNKISSGQKNYAEVVRMIISLPARWW